LRSIHTHRMCYNEKAPRWKGFQRSSIREVALAVIVIDSGWKSLEASRAKKASRYGGEDVAASKQLLSWC
jgi:hypothetical protein